MKPTIGRIVHYRQRSEEEWQPAIITEVNSHELVEVQVFGRCEDFGKIDHAEHVDNAYEGSMHVWRWPPRDE